MNSAAPRVVTIPAKQELSKGKAIAYQLRVAAYCRVSTDDEEQLTSYEAQKNYYTDKIMNNKEWTMAGIFADEGITGTSARKRPEFIRMIRLCRQNKIDVVLTKSISRFARNTVDCLNYIRALKALEIAVIFEKENINTLETDSEILITMLSAFAQAESESISANVRWGKRQAMREGKVSFQYSKLYGYERGEDNKPQIIPEQAEVVRHIFNVYLAGDSVRTIKKTLDDGGIKTNSGDTVWSVSTIQGILRNEKYCGDAILQKTYISDCISRKVVKNNGQLPKYLIQNSHEGIINRQIFDAVQAEIARRAGTKAASQKKCVSGRACYSSQYALTERLVCGECGTLYRRCTWSRSGKKRIIWRCISRLEYGTKYCKDSPTLDEAPLHAAILAAINSAMSSKNDLISQITDAILVELSPVSGETMSIGDIDRRIESLHAEMKRLLECSASEGGFTAYADRFKTMTDEVNTLNERKATLQHLHAEDTAATYRIKEAETLLQETSPELAEWDDHVIRQLVNTVKVLSANKIRIYLNNGAEIEQELIK